MLNGLKLWNFPTGPLSEQEMCGETFVLKTCQRTLVLAFDRNPFSDLKLNEHELHSGDAAYLFLLETICGLKSKLIGENEIVAQFKDAYKEFAASPSKNTQLLAILEKLFKDAKDIRTQYLVGISQKTYASLTRRHLIQKARATHVVILGSGQLAEDLINQFKKKATVSICARNTAKATELARLHNINVIPWEKRDELVNEPFIANTIGADSVLFDEAFFESWAHLNSQRLFVDLGAPSVIRTSLTLLDGIVRLTNIFDEGAIVEGQKQQQIQLARAAMLETTFKRKALFEAKLNRTAELLAPQITKDVRYL